MSGRTRNESELRNTYWMMVIFACFFMCGCASLFKLEKTAPPPAPVPIGEDAALIELKRRTLQFGIEAGRRVYEDGAQSKAPLVDQQIRALQGLAVTEGNPAEPLKPPTSVAKAHPGVDSVLRKLEKANKRYQERLVAWWTDYEQFRGTPVKTGWNFSIPLLNVLGPGGIVVLVLLILLGVPVIPLLFRALAGVRKALKQTVSGVQGFLDDDEAPSESKDALKTSLDSSQDEEVKLRIDEIKRELKALERKA